MDILYKVISIIAYVEIGIIGIGMLWQFIFIFFGWLKPKHFRKASKLNRFAIIIPAHNEEAVIGNTVKKLLTEQTYPKDLYDVYVCADNCTDQTKKAAEEAGAVVYERFTDDPSKKRASYPIKLLIDNLMKGEKKYDAVIKFDADNLANPQYIEEMNNALEEGCEIARAHEASTNLGQNVWTSVSGCYYIRDSRLASNFRERAHLNSMLTGAGMMVSMKVLEETGGWDAMSTSDDAEFSVKRMLEKRRIHYVADAIVYEDQPSTYKDTTNRISRMAYGLNKIFWHQGFKLLGKMFTTGYLSYFDMFCQLMFIPISLFSGWVLGIYFTFFFVVHFLQCLGVEIVPTLYATGWTLAEGSSCHAIIVMLIILACALVGFYALYTFQSWLAARLDKEVLGPNGMKDAKKGIWLSTPFMMIYGNATSYGITHKPTWAVVKRNLPPSEKK